MALDNRYPAPPVVGRFHDDWPVDEPRLVLLGPKIARILLACEALWFTDLRGLARGLLERRTPADDGSHDFCRGCPDCRARGYPDDEDLDDDDA